MINYNYNPDESQDRNLLTGVHKVQIKGLREVDANSGAKFIAIDFQTQSSGKGSLMCCIVDKSGRAKQAYDLDKIIKAAGFSKGNVNVSQLVGMVFEFELDVQDDKYQVLKSAKAVTGRKQAEKPAPAPAADFGDDVPF